MTGESRHPSSPLPLFRQAALEAPGYRLFGSVVAILPPSAIAACAVALLAIALLSAAAWLVEIPLRSPATGVLMPSGGFLEIVATESGRVGSVHAIDGQKVAAGFLLAEIVADDATASGESLSGLTLESLQAELTLLDRSRTVGEAIETSRLAALRQQTASAKARHSLLHRQIATEQQRLRLQAGRVSRLSGLVREGHAASEALRREEVELMRLESGAMALYQRNVDLQQEIADLEQARREVTGQADLERARHQLQQERIRRERVHHEYRSSQGIRSPVDAVVARMLVRSGAAVRRGQPIAKLYRDADAMEAWLYLASSAARMLEPGQTVRVRLDSYPAEVFGTQFATVISVSRVALVPEELPVPLVINGPVFEVRAAIDSVAISAIGRRWSLAPGTSFKADIIQRRLRLFEWLLKSIDQNGNGRRG